MAEVEKVLVSTEAKADRLNIEAKDVRNVDFKFVQPFQLVAVRVVRSYLQTLLGLLTAAGAGGATGLIPFNDFQDLLIKSLTLSLAPAVVSLLQNVLEILAKLDKTQPELRG